MNNSKIAGTYNDIYLPILHGYDVGFKLILGPTGNGKTSALYQDHNNNDNDFVFKDLAKRGKKAIFTTHRKNIIKDVLNGCQKSGIKYVHLQANADIIKGIINRKNGVDSLINALSDLNFFSATSDQKTKSVDKKYCKKKFLYIADLNNSAKNTRDENEVRDECGRLLSIFRRAITTFFQNDQAHYKRILKNKFIQTLFPFIAFISDPNKVVLLSTLQRLSLPFFDGKKQQTLYDLNGYVIFMDEFDYLSTAMLDNIIECQKNKRPVNFVSLFCEHFVGNSHNHKVIQKARDIATEFESDMIKLGISFPRGNIEKYKFSNADGLFKKKDGTNFGYIFDGGYIISSGVFYIRDEIEANGRAKSLVLTDNDSKPNFLAYSDKIKYFEKKIFNFLNHLKRQKGKTEDGKSYDSIVQDVYNENNDLSITEYQKFIENNHPANNLGNVSLRKLLNIVKHNYIHDPKKKKESVISELSLSESIKSVDFYMDDVLLSSDLTNKLLINESTVKRAKWILPNSKDLPSNWETYIFADCGEIQLCFAKGSSAMINNHSSYLLKTGKVIRLIKAYTPDNNFKAVLIYPNIKKLDCDDQFYSEGYNYTQISNAQKIYDPNRIEINNYNMSITPEGLLFALTARNLVFGLTATGDIERSFGSFALNWHREALKIFQKAENKKANPMKVYIDSSFDVDDKLIFTMLQEKQVLRKTKLLGNVRKAILLNNQDDWSNKLINALEVIGTNSMCLYGDKNVTEGIKKFRRNRVSRHFECLRWILEESQRDTHLVFTDTFNLTLKIFQYFDKVTQEGNKFDDVPQGFLDFIPCLKYRYQGNAFTAIEIKHDKSEKSISTVFSFTLNRELKKMDCYVIFANAKNWDKIYDNNKQSYNRIFDKAVQEKSKVVVITQHESASNGVNLQFSLTSANNKIMEKDFEGLHILDPQYFYFSEDNKDNEDEEDEEDDYHYHNNSNAKEKSIYWANKLKINKDITITQLKKFIGHLKFKNINNDYKKTTDYMCNVFALLSQEVGRVERTRVEARSTEVTISKDIHDVIANIFEKNNGWIGEAIYHQRKKRISTLLNDILEDLNKAIDKNISENNRKGEPLHKISTRYHKKMDIIIKNDLPALRSGKLSKEKAKKVRKLWADIRIAALKGEYEAKLDNFDFSNLCHVKTKYLTHDENDRDVVYIKDDSIIPKREAECKSYFLNNIYTVVQENTVIRNYFNRKNFQLKHSFNKNGYHNIFIPEFQQAILTAAIGEEGIKALLQHAGIEIEDDNAIPDELFELFDFKVKGLPIYIDAKNWNAEIIRNFDSEHDDPDIHNKLHHHSYVKKGKNTLQTIKSLDNENVKIIYINLKHEEGHYTKQAYFRDEQCQQVLDYKRASFVYLAGVLDSSYKNKHHEIFDELLYNIEESLRENYNA